MQCLFKPPFSRLGLAGDNLLRLDTYATYYLVVNPISSIRRVFPF